MSPAREKARKTARTPAQSTADERFHSMVRLTADFYWETDSGHRLADIVYGPRHISTQARGSHLGKRRWEVPSSRPDAAGWAAHKATMDAHAAFHDFEFSRSVLVSSGNDGGERHYAISGEPAFDPEGRFRGYRGVGRDITERKRAERLLALEHAVARLMAEGNALEETLTAALRLLCESERWDCARFLRVDADGGILRFAAFWCAPGDPVEAILAKSRDVEYRPGIGVPGKAWLSEQPLWVANIHTDPHAPRMVFPYASGIRSAFAFPIRSEGKTLGVLAFNSREIRQPDERLLQAVAAIGNPIGQFLKRSAAEEALRENEARFQATFNETAAGMAHVDTAGGFILVNQRLCDILGYSRQELLGKTIPQLSHPADAHVTDEMRRRLLAGEIDKFSKEKRYLRKDGTAVWVGLSVSLIRDRNGRPSWEIAVFEDISARKHAEEALRESEERFRSLTQLSSDFFWETDTGHRFTGVVLGPNYAAPDAPRSPRGRTPWEMTSVEPDAAGWAALKAKMESQVAFHDFELARATPDGSIRHFSVSGEPRRSREGVFMGYRGVGRDVTELVQARERVASLAYSDALTGLANRTSLSPALERAVNLARRHGTKLALAFLDLDGFKQVNDAHGHDIGDRVLVEVAKRLRACLRSEDLVARLGGDEFVVLLEQVSDTADVHTVAAKLLREIAHPYALDGGQELRLSVSAGISLLPEDAGDPRTLMKHADTAMYRAKQSGKNCYRLFASEAET